MAVKKEFQALTIPQLKWNDKTLTSSYGELVAQPLEPGFGFTLGGALRRVLLGGVEGSAVTAVVIKGVNNEFSSLPGVVEDAMQVILNCKEIIIRNKTGAAGTMSLSVKGEKTVTVGDITADEHLVLINKDHVLAHVARGGSLDIEFFVESGRGYQQAKWPIGKALQEDGRIYVDSFFSPVKNVTYHVEKVRVGKNIDFDKLTLSITTDATQTPVDVLHYAVSVLRTQLEHFLSSAEIPFNEISKPLTEEKNEKVPEKNDVVPQGVSPELFFEPIDALEFSVRAHNCLVTAGINRIIDLVNLSESDVLKIKNFGRKSFDEVKESMKSFGLSFGMNINEAQLKDSLRKEKDHETSGK